MAKKPRKDDNPWKAAGLVSAIGADLVVCMLLGYYGGVYLSDIAGGQRGWIVAGLLAGLIAGVVSIYFIIKSVLEDTDE